MKRIGQLVPLSTHPIKKVSALLSQYDFLKTRGSVSLYTQHLARYTGLSDSSDLVQRRIDSNLGKAFDRASLALLVREELRPLLRSAPNAFVLNQDTGPLGADTPEQPPGLKELWDTPWIYRNFRDFSEILWGQDWDDIDNGARVHGEHLYEIWLDMYVQSHNDINDFLGDIQWSLNALLDLIHDVFDAGGDLLDELLEDLSKWLFKQFGFSF